MRCVKDSASRGFALPLVIGIIAVLFIMAVGALLVSGVERGSSRAFLEFERAELAAGAGLDEIRSVLDQETANDSYTVIQENPEAAIDPGKVPASRLFIARGRADDSGYVYRYVPLFSALGVPDEDHRLKTPDADSLSGGDAGGSFEFQALPYQEKVRVAWHPVHDAAGRQVARYAYVVEDMQGKLDPRKSGNTAGEGQTHVRAGPSFPAPGLNPADEKSGDVPLDQIALYAIEPGTGHGNLGAMGKELIRNRALEVSPNSMLAAAGIKPPLVRDRGGRLCDLKARAAEENLVVGMQPYFERPLIPHVPGIQPAMAGTTRMNLNALLALDPHLAVDRMSSFIRAALPDFDKRKGGFPEDYIRTLAANAIDYADVDSRPTLRSGQCRGLDACPLMSELALQIQYEGISNKDGRKIMGFRFKVFCEVFNPCDQPVAGNARVSYEVALPMDGIGSGVGGVPFDSPMLLDDPSASTHDLTWIDGRYWSREVAVSLQPNQYRCYLFADVAYRMDVGAATDSIPGGTPFSLNEAKGASGISFMWNGDLVERVPAILRQSGLIYSKKNGVVTGGFRVGTPETITKAALPGQVYDDYPDMYYNMGDPRMSHYLRAAPLDENAYPENASPNRRNIRLEIYKADAPEKPKVYARVLPSEWPDGGHDAAVGTWVSGSNDKTEMTDPKFDFPYDPDMGKAALQPISNRGRFLSVTELGRVYDPVMHAPTFPASEETNLFRSKGKMPTSRTSWPDVTVSQPSTYYGGGNTLRIGRQEHPAFDQDGKPGMHAARLLDLFHCGRSRSSKASEREGSVVRIDGHVNINTATRDALRAMAAGALVRDPLLGERSGSSHLGAPVMAPPVTPVVLSAPTRAEEADRIADAVIRSRPFGSAADLARARDSNGDCVFGNRSMYPAGDAIEWSDAAAEEVFARVHEGATVRSRNFRVWIVAQALVPKADPGRVPEVCAEVRKVYTLFADPGVREADGSIAAGKFKTRVMSCNEF